MILTLNIFLILVILDALLLYTYFALNSAHIVVGLRKLFLKQNGWLFIVLNFFHAACISKFFYQLNYFWLIGLFLTILIYLFPKAIEKILNFNLFFFKKKFAK